MGNTGRKAPPRGPQRSKALRVCAVAMLVAGCGDTLGVGTSASAGSIGDKAWYAFNCDFGGTSGELIVDVDPVENAGVTWGPGADPDITGVIATGSFTFYTSGTLTLSDRTYSFEGENAFADLWSDIPGDRLTVEWQHWERGLFLIWDWFDRFGPTTAYRCEQTDSSSSNPPPFTNTSPPPSDVQLSY